MSDKEFPSCAYDVCAEFDCEETMALALIATRNDLERTRKALDLSCGALKEISLSYQNGLDKPVAPAKWFSIATDMCDYADNAIEQITALEQKD